MAIPTKDDVLTHVINTIAAFTKREPSKVKEEMVLAKTPLNMDSNDLVQLATSLRAYVLVHREGEGTVTVTDTKRNNETVGGLATVVHARLKEDA